MMVASFAPVDGVDITSCVLFGINNAPVITTCVARVIETAEEEKSHETELVDIQTYVFFFLLHHLLCTSIFS